MSLCRLDGRWFGRARPSVVPCTHAHPRHHHQTTSSEWLTNQHRDTYATHLGHHDQLAYFAVAQNDAVGRVRYQLLEVR